MDYEKTTDSCAPDKMGDLKMRMERVNSLYHIAKDLGQRTSEIADRVYGPAPDNTRESSGKDVKSGDMRDLDVQLDMLEAELRGAHDQIARLQDL